MFEFMNTQPFGIVIIFIIVTLGFIYLSMTRANKEYMKCLCGKQPELMLSYPMGDKKPYFGYVCKCGREAPLASTTDKAAYWWQFRIIQEEMKVTSNTIDLKIKEENKKYAC